MRRLLLVLGSLVAVAIATPVDAQLKLGAHAAVLTGVDRVNLGSTPMIDRAEATYGMGGRVMLDPPLLPFAVVGTATYYFADEGEGYYSGTVAGQLRIPLPIVKPYLTVGYQVRKAEGEDGQTGFMAGLGAQLDLALSLFLEATLEFNEASMFSGSELDNTPLVIKGGILFGG